MNQKMGIFVGILLVVVVIVVYFGMSISYKNDEIGLRNRAAAQLEVLQAVFDNTWKIISQQAQISEQYKETFKEVYPNIMNERYGGGTERALFNFVREHNPEFDIGLYAKLADAVQVERTKFTSEQKKMASIKQEHSNLIQQWPGSMFLSSKQPLDWKPLTSAKTKAAFETGEENDVDLFKKAE